MIKQTGYFTIASELLASHFTVMRNLLSSILLISFAVLYSDALSAQTNEFETRLKKFLSKGQIEKAVQILIPPVSDNNLGAMTTFYLLCNNSGVDGCTSFNPLGTLEYAADAGYPAAVHYLSLRRYQDARNDQDRSIALNILSENFNTGYAPSGTLLGDLAMEAGTKEGNARAVEYYNAASRAGDAGADFKLGVLSEIGRGLPKNVARAISYYGSAAERGNESAVNALGIAYQVGKTVEPDREKAADLFRSAAKMGHTGAQYNLATLLLGGPNPELDFFEATLWLKRAAKSGNIDAQDRLGTAFYKGEGVKRDAKLAEKWFLKAALRGHPDAQFSLGTLYNDRNTGIWNYTKAKKWLNSAMAQGLPEAYIQMGKYHLYGAAIVAGKADPAEARRLFAKAEALGGDLKSEASEWKEYAASRRRVVEGKLSSSEAAILAIVGLGILGAIAGGGRASSGAGTIMSNCPGMNSGGFGMACSSGTDTMITGAMTGLF